MKMIFKKDTRYIIEIDKNKYCYVTKKDIMFSDKVETFLKFDPYIEYVEDKKIEIPKEVVEKIKEEE